MRSLPFLLAALVLSGCATDPDLGAAYRINMAQQVVNPNPQYAGTPIEGSSGERSVTAVERYLKRATEPLAKATGSQPR